MSEQNLPADELEVQRVLSYASKLANLKEISVSISGGRLVATARKTDDKFVNLLPQYIQSCYSGDLFF